jgi:hypothetical protein
MKMIYERTYHKGDLSMTNSQIGARKKKSVRNHLFVINSIISDVMSSVRKDPIDLSIMDFKQMFDSEELSTCLNALYDADIQDDMLALIFQANKTTYFAVKTPNGITEQTSVCNKILQGDVLAPLISGNMVDKYIGLQAMNSHNVYIYKNKVIIPPLTMQDDTLGISNCGYRTQKMNTFLNTQTNLMGLQFGRDKCEKMHIGKKPRNLDLCIDSKVDAWEVMVKKDQQVDTYIGKEVMKNVEEKTYLGHIIQKDGKNTKNITDKFNKAVGNVNKIISAINARPYGHHTYKAALLMRQGLMLSGMLRNSETWINITEADMTKLTMPDTMLQRKILSSSGNPSKVFMSLELGVIPVRNVIMAKRLNFLHYILNENTSSIIHQLYEVLKSDSRRGDFYNLVQKDLKKLNINMDDNTIREYSPVQWKKYVRSKVKENVLQNLTHENSMLEKTKDITFSELKLNDYLVENRSINLSRIIFSLRSKTLDIKTWQPWKYFDNLCVMCELKEESISHFLNCEAYENISQENTWKDVRGNCVQRQYEIAEIAQARIKRRNNYNREV